jgi:beta-lactam-binding protein with PASTA domain
VFKFITGKPLWANILLGIGILVILVLVFLQSLGWITRHDETMAVPSVTGKSFDEAKKILETQGFKVEIQDTVYNDTAALLSVVKQFPNAEARVKMKRTVYLTINRDAAPDIEMPNLEGMSFRSAAIAIQQHQLKLGDTIYTKDFAKDMVLEQHYHNKRIAAGTKLPMGSSIDLVLARGTGSQDQDMPDLFGMTLGEARQLLESNGLTLGEPRDGDPNAYVYKQSPEHLTLSGRVNKIRQGQIVDLWVQAQKPVRQAGGDSTAQGY